jgi:YegS/Rv2252/BmrU family lipid kinase
MRKLLLIVNPNAGRMRAGSALLDLVTGFSAHGYEVTVFPTAAVGDAEVKAYECSADYDLTVCYGGDGTLSEMVNGTVRTCKSPPFGFIPAGTSNDFARTLAMPHKIPSAVSKIVKGSNVPLDIGAFNERYFIYVAAFGLFTSVSYVVPQGAKKAFGHLAYVAEGVKQAIDVPAYEMDIEYDGNRVSGKFAVGLVMNTTSVAGMFKLNRSQVKLDDGVFELVLVRKPQNNLVLSKIIMDLSAQNFHADEHIIFERVKNVKITSKDKVAWCLDGENGGLHTNAEITNLHRKGIIRI